MYNCTHTQEGNQLSTELCGVLIIISLQIILSCVFVVVVVVFVVKKKKTFKEFSIFRGPHYYRYS